MKELISTKKQIEDLNRQKEELDAQQKHLEDKIIQLEEEKQRLHDDTAKAIEDACNEKFFCGIILTAHDISAIVKLAIDTKEPIRIAFRLYPVDDTEPDKQPDQNTDQVKQIEQEDNNINNN